MEIKFACLPRALCFPIVAWLCFKPHGIQQGVATTQPDQTATKKLRLSHDLIKTKADLDEHEKIRTL